MNTMEYFRFESDFVEENIRCIPMTVRLKLDLAGIKLSLAAWSRCTVEERYALATLQCYLPAEKRFYRQLLVTIILRTTGEAPVEIPVDTDPPWDNCQVIPSSLQDHVKLYGLVIDKRSWSRLTRLQRFALLKLCRPGHENRNFPLAIKEFGLINYLPEKLAL
ncbi:nitrate reductase associated protein [Flavihumibacter solisilvae]|nr:nitrate reductase associated protein [Flavihumibacter solisilvae]